MLSLARLCLFALFLWLPALASAQVTVEYQGTTYEVATYEEAIALANRLGARNERILRYDIAIQIHPDSTLAVEETIHVHAEGQSIRRGIYRDYPTRYKDRYGNNVTVGFHVQGVLRDGKPEPWFTEHLSNGTRVNTGNDDILPAPADYTYTLRYTTTRQLGFFKDHDELYWNAIGTGWMFPIEQATVSVRLPQPVSIEQLHAEGYTGTQGAVAQNFVARLPSSGQATWTLTQPLQPHEGLTIVFTFPKGIVLPPTTEQRIRWFAQDNRGPLVGFATLLLMLGYLYLRWRQVGRDPEPGIIITRYDPPQGYSPAALRFIKKMNGDDKCFTADVVALAVAGHVRIRSEKKLPEKDEWTLERTLNASAADLPDSQRALLKELFIGSDAVPVTTANRSKFMSAKLAQLKSMNKAFNPRMFKHNGGSTGIAFVIGLVGMIAASDLAAGSGTPLLILIGIAMLVLLLVFAWLLPAPTLEGRKLLDEIEGLKRYLNVAERDELARLQHTNDAPVLDAGRYERLLPYAIALDVEGAWTDKFTAAVGSAEAQRTTSNMAWYHGAGISNLGQLSSALGSGLNTSIASASTPPGSSSGSGGGGSSGGGGGGGGGGGR